MSDCTFKRYRRLGVPSGEEIIWSFFQYYTDNNWEPNVESEGFVYHTYSGGYWVLYVYGCCVAIYDSAANTYITESDKCKCLIGEHLKLWDIFNSAELSEHLSENLSVRRIPDGVLLQHTNNRIKMHNMFLED